MIHVFRHSNWYGCSLLPPSVRDLRNDRAELIVLVLQFMFPEAAEYFILRHAVFNPLTWFTSCCMHGGIIHLIGNMILLAICGWIIEGKVGWWKFILIYFAIGVSANAFEHCIMYWISESGSLGASGVIFGMLAIVMIWAPENEVTLFYFLLLFLFPMHGVFSASIMGFCFVMIALEFLTVWLSFFEMSSALLHMIGVVPGALIGYVTVKRRWVDCEGYDLMSIQSGNAGKRVLTTADERKLKEERQLAREAAQQEQDNGLARVEDYIAKGHFEVAWRRFQMLNRKNKSLILREDQYVAIINGLQVQTSPQAQALSAKTVPEVMRSYLQHYSALRIPITIKLARHVLQVEERPRECIRIMREIEGETLQGKQLKLAKAIIAMAKKQMADGAIDFL